MELMVELDRKERYWIVERGGQKNAAMNEERSRIGNSLFN